MSLKKLFSTNELQTLKKKKVLPSLAYKNRLLILVSKLSSILIHKEYLTTADTLQSNYIYLLINIFFINSKLHKVYLKTY